MSMLFANKSRLQANDDKRRKEAKVGYTYVLSVERVDKIWKMSADVQYTDGSVLNRIDKNKLLYYD